MPSADQGKEVTGKLAEVQKEKVAASDKIYGEIDSAQSRLMPRIEQLSKDAGAEAEKMKPWNADEEAAKRRTDPITAFGSFGSVFGILASAFTHAPMENALNASAAAMTAIKQGDDKAYDRAHKAWEDNLKMAMDRHKIQHDAYQDAVSLLSTNMQAAQIKLQVLAARFGDKQVQTLLEAGMSKEVEEVLAARQRNALALQEAMPKIVAANAQMSRLFALGYDPKNPTSEKSQEALVKFRTEAAQLKSMEHGGIHTPGRDEAEAIRLRAERLKSEAAAKGETLPDDEAFVMAKRDIRLRTATPTGNKIDELTGKVNRVEYMESTIDKLETLLAKHNAIAGLGGAITRPAESISNVLGSSETDRRQFERYVLELQEWAPQALNDRNGRPLSAEAGKIAGIIAGLRVGDTTANTVRAYRELKPLLARIKADLGKRRGDTQAPAEAKPEKQPSWRDAPVVQQ